jgi:hypothetical protein
MALNGKTIEQALERRELMKERRHFMSQAEQEERAFSFVRVNRREAKLRTPGVTEIRGPSSTPM